MGLPNVLIKFQTVANTATKRSDKGIVALIVKDAAGNGAYSLKSIKDIPKDLGASNIDYISRTFLGNVNPPRQVLLYVIDSEGANFQTALDYFSTCKLDYLCGPSDITTEQSTTIKNWVEAERDSNHMVKAVLPNIKADSKAIVNFTTKDIRVGDKTYTAAEYCSRIAGLIAGTPMTMSCTYSVLPEVTDCERLTKEQLDSKIDAGEFIIFNDGEKVKAGRGVNSLTTANGNDKVYKKIKIVEAMDLINTDIRLTTQDSYIGKFPNSYDDKCILITAIKNYFRLLENDRILDVGKSDVSIDLDAQIQYLKSKNMNTDDMSEQEIKEANTDSKVFLKASIKILDAIEDVDLVITI